MQHSTIARCVGLVMSCALTLTGTSQEVLYTPSATSPGEGILATRHNFSYESFDKGPGNASFGLDQYTIETAIAYGITSDLTFMMHLPYRIRSFEGPGSPGDADGIDDMRTMLKYRFFQEDIGNIDTIRMSMLGGVEIPSYDDDFSSDSFDPFIGWALTMIEGRHGFGAHAMYQLNTGDDETDIGFNGTEADAFRFDGSYLYRIDPVAYTIDTTKSTYIMVELNQRYEVNGDLETLISPGFLIEARTWAAEVAVRLPVHQEIDHRAELEWALTIGLRFTY